MVESIPILIELIESGNRQGEVLYRYGRSLSLTGQAARSVWALDAAREDPDWFLQASQQLAIDAHRGGNFQFALDVFKRVHEQSPEALEDDLMGLLLEARVMLDIQDHFEEALVLIDSIIERFPEEETAIRMKAVALLGLRRPDEAYELLRAANVSPLKPAGDEPRIDDGATKEVPGATDGEAMKPAGSDELGESGDLYAEIPDDASEAFWCTVRVSFKREAGDFDDAEKVADDCLEKFPTDGGVIGQAIKLYSEVGKYDKVLGTLETAYKESPNDPQIRGAMLQQYEYLGRLKDVERILRKSIDEAEAAGQGDTPEMASHWVELAGFLMERNRVGEALLVFDSANKIIGENATPDLLLREAEALIRAKKYDEALTLAAKTPVEVHRVMLRGRIAFEKGAYQEALRELGEAALLWPDNAPTRFYRARAAEGIGDFDLAIEEYRQAIRSDPSLAPARERLAKLHLGEGDVREAAAILMFDSPRKSLTASVEMQVLMVEIETLRGSEPDLDIDPSVDYPIEKLRRDTIEVLGRALSLRANAKVAAAVLAELEKSSPAPLRGNFLRERVSLLLEIGEKDSAVLQARKGMDERPDDLDSQLALGRALVAGGRELERAEVLLRGVVENRSDDADAWTAIGDLEVQRKDLTKADESYDRALSIDPGHWAALAPRVEHLFQSGRSSDAVKRLESYVALDAPYDGRGALELARRLPDTEGTRERRLRLGKQALRFGAGQPAMDFLVALDPSLAPPPALDSEPSNPGDAKPSPPSARVDSDTSDTQAKASTGNAESTSAPTRPDDSVAEDEG